MFWHNCVCLFACLFVCLFISGQGSLLLKYWRWIGTIKDSIPEQYKVELGAVEEQGDIELIIISINVFCNKKHLSLLATCML